MSTIPREARPYQGSAAGVVSRTMASAIDAAVVCGVVAVGYAGLNAALFLLSPRRFEAVAASAVVSVTAGLVVLVAYLALAWLMTGRTYGCHVMGLRVVSRRGTPIRAPVAVARALTCALFPLGLFWCAFDRTSRSLHDHAFRTSVVYDWTQGGSRRAAHAPSEPA